MKETLTKNKLPLITLIGPPNSGKTTLFNILSGKNYKTVNYPGSTVEYSISKILSKYSINANILDSPGIISLIPSSPDEKVSVDSLFSHPEFGTPDIVAVTVDVSQLSRHLYLVKQLINSNFRVIVVLTMNDILKRKGFEISAEKLASILNCEVIKVDGRNGKGVDELLKSIRKQIKEIIDTETGAVIHHAKSGHDLIDSFRKIEEIENDVLVTGNEKDTNGSFDIQSVNEKLVVLNAARNYAKPDEFTLKADKIILHKYLGLLIFFFIMALTFTSIFWLAAPAMDLISEFFSYMSEYAAETAGDGWFGNLISNGIINGVGSVLVFLPQILILFLILGLLEDTGYLARGAMLIDKPLSKIGLNGKSFVPLLSGFACAIPAMMATRTIANRKERLLTIFIIPLMSCSARLPVYALMIAFLLPRDKPWYGGIALSAIYIFSILSSVIIAAIVNKFSSRLIMEKDNSSFILELPAYRRPSLNTVIGSSINNAKQYLLKAGPVILYLSLILWFITYFPDVNPETKISGKSQDEISQMKNSERIANSYAAKFGKFIEPVMEPIGMDWRIGVSLISAFAAREVFVSSMALIFKITDDEDNLQNSLLESMKSAEIEDTGQKLFTTATTTGLIVFFVFAMQCLSTVAISRKETGSWRIPLLQLAVFTSLAYLLTFISVNGLRAFGIN